MTIFCNDTKVQLNATTLSAALIELGYANATIATAVNGEFVPKLGWGEVTLQPGDRIDVVAPMQGG